MSMRKTRKDFLSMKEFQEGLASWLEEKGWSPGIYWHDAEHKACNHHPVGNWKLQGYGHYEASDWTWKNYVSFRCTRCGMMVQFNQDYSEEKQSDKPVTRLVIVP